MSKAKLIFFFISLLVPLFAHDFNIIHVFTNNRTDTGIPFSRGMAGYGNSPDTIYLDNTEKTMYLVDGNIEIIYEIKMESFTIKKIPVPTPRDRKYKAMLGHEIVIEIAPSIFLGIRANSFDIFEAFTDAIYLGVRNDRWYNHYNVHPVGSHVFYYDERGSVRCVDLEGNNLSVEEAHKVLLDYNRRLPADEKARMTRAHQQMLEGKRHIILGDRYYQSSLYEMFGYFQNVYNKNHSIHEDNPKSKIFIGFDNDHVGYWLFNKTDENMFIQGYDRQGNIVVTHNYVNEFRLLYNESFPRFHLARESGNIYAMQTDAKEGTIVYKMNHAWGKPNMLAIAINGMGENSAYDDYVEKTLSSFSKADLRLQRNHLFALNGYVFNSADLKEYFGKQNWYEPDPDVTSSVDTLSEAQKKLFEHIRELEAQ